VYRYEGSQQGITWATMHDGAFPFSKTLLLLLLDTVLYLLLAWYLDAVVPVRYTLLSICISSVWVNRYR